MSRLRVQLDQVLRFEPRTTEPGEQMEPDFAPICTVALRNLTAPKIYSNDISSLIVDHVAQKTRHRCGYGADLQKDADNLGFAVGLIACVSAIASELFSLLFYWHGAQLGRTISINTTNVFLTSKPSLHMFFGFDVNEATPTSDEKAYHLTLLAELQDKNQESFSVHSARGPDESWEAYVQRQQQTLVPACPVYLHYAMPLLGDPTREVEEFVTSADVCEILAEHKDKKFAVFPVVDMCNKKIHWFCGASRPVETLSAV